MNVYTVRIGGNRAPARCYTAQSVSEAVAKALLNMEVCPGQVLRVRVSRK